MHVHNSYEEYFQLHMLEICSYGYHWQKHNIVSGNCLVLWGKKPWAEQDTWCNNAPLWDSASTQWPMGDVAVISKVQFSNLLYRIVAWAFTVELLSWLLQDLAKEKSTVVQVMAWCRQATSHYLSQCRAISILHCHVASLGHNELTDWGRDIMIAILQTAFSCFWFQFHWSMFPWVQLLRITHHWFS